jgi:hypothetical protein
MELSQSIWSLRVYVILSTYWLRYTQVRILLYQYICIPTVLHVYIQYRVFLIIALCYILTVILLCLYIVNKQRLIQAIVHYVTYWSYIFLPVTLTISLSLVILRSLCCITYVHLTCYHVVRYYTYTFISSC